MKAKYKVYKNKLTHLLRILKELIIIKNWSIKSNLGKIWNLIKQILDKGNKTDPLHEFGTDKKLVNVKDEIANAFNNFFTNIGPNLAKLNIIFKIPKLFVFVSYR